MKLIKLDLMGNTPKDDVILIVNPSHIISVEQNSDTDNIVCFVRMRDGENYTVRNTAAYILSMANS